MRIKLQEYLNFYKTTAQERMFALGEVEAEAREQDAEGLAGLLALVAEARAHDEETLRLEAIWRGQSDKENSHGPRAREFDDELDRALAGLNGHLQAQYGLYPEDHPRRAAAAALEEAFFPGGMRAVSKVTYTAQHSEVGRILKLAEGENAKRAIVLLDLEEPLARLRALWEAYGDELNLRGERVAADDLRAARSFGEELMAEVIIAILAARKPGERGLGRRLRLLEPVERLNDRMRAYHKARVRRGAEEPADEAQAGDGASADVTEAA